VWTHSASDVAFREGLDLEHAVRDAVDELGDPPGRDHRHDAPADERPGVAGPSVTEFDRARRL
jgi:hypothetical protein